VFAAEWLSSDSKPSRIATVTDGPRELEQLVNEQIAHYRAIAEEYEDHALPFPGGEELSAALDAFRPVGTVLELACGQGLWTGHLIDYADQITAVDASPEMLAIAATRVDSDKVRFVRANIFDWVPEHQYDVVFFGFWLSHVPLERFGSFWTLVANCLKPGGRVFFVDDAYRTPDELVGGESSTTIQRRLNDGTSHRIVKVPHHPADLEERLSLLGWSVKVSSTGPYCWGAGSLV
jgi:SAM-dependent methyltransferase